MPLSCICHEQLPRDGLLTVESREPRPSAPAHGPPTTTDNYYVLLSIPVAIGDAPRWVSPPCGEEAAIRFPLFTYSPACNDHMVCIACTIKLNGGHRKSSHKSGARTQRNEYRAQFNVPTDCVDGLLSKIVKAFYVFKSTLLVFMKKQIHLKKEVF